MKTRKFSDGTKVRVTGGKYMNHTGEVVYYSPGSLIPNVLLTSLSDGARGRSYTHANIFEENLEEIIDDFKSDVFENAPTVTMVPKHDINNLMDISRHCGGIINEIHGILRKLRDVQAEINRLIK